MKNKDVIAQLQKLNPEARFIISFCLHKHPHIEIEQIEDNDEVVYLHVSSPNQLSPVSGDDNVVFLKKKKDIELNE